MSEHEAFDALSALDGPADLEPGSDARIEAAMLARFDAVAGAVPTDGGGTVGTIVPLDARRRPADRRRGAGVLLVAAAVLAVIVVGAFVGSSSDEPSPSDVPGSTVPVTVDEAQVVRRLAAYCDEYIVPLRDADSSWFPNGQWSEQRSAVLTAVEQAADAMSLLSGPLGERLSIAADRSLAAATEARRADTVFDPDGDEAVLAAGDRVFDGLTAAGVPELPAACLP